MVEFCVKPTRFDPYKILSFESNGTENMLWA